LIGNKVTKDTFFVSVTGENLGAFPMRTKQGTVFNGQTGTYHVTIHEFKAALDLGLFKPKRIERTIDFGDKTSFAEFVDTYYREREISKRTGDIVTNLFTKFVLNSAYGKFAQNPENCFDFCIHPVNNILAGTWTPAFVAEGKYVVWKKPSEQGDMLRHNVATAASVTGAARSVLLRALAHATRPLYCDTDSIICESLDGVSIDKAKLGAWKLEETGTRVAIAGRKLYAVFQDDECVKKACKGVKITAEEIERIANGETIEYNRPVPSYKWDGSYSFITRKVRMT
jgi:hypothetical protein